MRKVINSIVPIIILFVILSAVVVASSSFKSENWAVPEGLQEYVVLRVIDGDTIEVEKLGKIRYIGVDTPETKHPSKPIEYMGQEAYEANKKLIEGKKVKLEFDVDRFDKYGRVLAYVYIGQVFVNAWLAEAGYAQVMTIPPNVNYTEIFLQLQQEAREAGRGLWGGNQGSKQIYYASVKSDKFHHPECEWAKKIKPENLVVFYSREEAIKAGYEPCKACKP